MNQFEQSIFKYLGKQLTVGHNFKRTNVYNAVIPEVQSIIICTEFMTPTNKRERP